MQNDPKQFFFDYLCLRSNIVVDSSVFICLRFGHADDDDEDGGGDGHTSTPGTFYSITKRLCNSV